ncbi:serpin family protein [Chondrinema litorale]|uniref:serpin family protein n=1 Tax=Chondrinema litorale TaxID=2994555 RepID=UPI0025434E7A|nr:serpin family protein [Chondrinema litorale]UZR95933.1 serpin family protein [Chondrinema litorale]
MKKIPLLLLLVFIFNSCNEDSIEPSKNTQQALSDLRKVSTQFTSNSNEFTFDIFQKVNASADVDENVMISPLSINLALGMLLNGSNGNSAEEIKEVLGWSDEDLAEINTNYKNILLSLPKLDNLVDVGIANSVWYDENFIVKDAFLNTLSAEFDANATPYDFSKSDAADLINRWIEDKTNGLIDEIIDKINPSQVMLLINTLYFKGEWTNKFDKDLTQQTAFTDINGEEYEVDMMMSNDIDLMVSIQENYTVFDLPYGDGIYTMSILLPNNGVNLNTILESLDTNDWYNLKNSKTNASAIVGLPKFEFGYDLNLNDVLQRLGIGDVFVNSLADLSNISDSELYVSEIKHKTYIKVDEEGTKAAAVTSVSIDTYSALPPTLNLMCDKPFAFFIYEKEQGNILFSGKIVTLKE